MRCYSPDSGSLARTRTQLVASCLGQALGAVACHDPKLNQRARQKAQRQQTDTVMILSAAARTDVEPFCSAFRLLQEAHNACTRKTLASTIDLEPEDESDTKSADESGATDGEDSDGPSAPSDLAGDADVTNLEELASVQHVLALLRRTARRSSAEADARLFTLAMRLHKQGKELAAKQSDVPATVPASVSERVAEWLFRLRRESFLAETLPSTDGSDGALSTSRVVEATVSNHDELCTLVQEIGTPLASIPTERILFLVEAGSRMYNLSMPSSDRDFVAIYASPTKQILSCINWPKECADNRGKSLPIEHCCYEARMFTEMLIKGNPNVIEMLFTNNVSYAHPLWEELVARRERLLSESALQQYVGWVVTHLKLIGKSTHIGREGKLFYHAFHKLGTHRAHKHNATQRNARSFTLMCTRRGRALARAPWASGASVRRGARLYPARSQGPARGRVFDRESAGHRTAPPRSSAAQVAYARLALPRVR